MSGAPYSVDLRGACAHVGTSRDTLLKAIHAGTLRASNTSLHPETGKATGKYVIKVADLEAWVDGLSA